MIYTSYFGNIKKLPTEMTLFSIAGKTPDWFVNAKKSYYKQYKDLAPKYEWWKEWKDTFNDNLESDESKAWYTEKYMSTVLDKLNIKKVLMDLSLDSLTKDACLLCYETPDKFCHRHLVAKWLNNNGIKCEEFFSS